MLPGGSGGTAAGSVVVLLFELLLLLLLLALDVVEVLVGGDGHAGDQQHHLAEADLRIPVDIKVLHDFVNGGLALHMLQRKGQGEGKSCHPQLKPPPSLAGTFAGDRTLGTVRGSVLVPSSPIALGREKIHLW